MTSHDDGDGTASLHHGTDTVSSLSEFGDRVVTTLEVGRHVVVTSDVERQRPPIVYRIAAAASSSLDLREISASVMAEIETLPDAACGMLYMLAPERQALELLAAFGFPDGLEPWVNELPPDQTSALAMLVLGDLDVLTDEHGTPAEMTQRLFRMGLEDNRWVMAGIRAGGKLLGVLGVTFRGHRPFTAEELELYRGIAASMGQPLANARLVGELSSANDRIADLVSDITARKQAERDLARATQRLDAHVTNSPLAIVEFDRDFIITRYSEEAERLFGWTAEEVLGEPMMSIPWVHEEDVPIVARESENLMSGKTPRSLNTNRNVRKDGAIVWCEWYSSAIYDEAGELLSVFSQVLDITERRESERLGERLNEIGAAIGSTLSRAEILERLFTLASDALNSDASAIATLEGRRWKLTHSQGVDADVVRTIVEAGSIPLPPQDRSRFSPVVLQDVDGYERLAPLAELGVRRLLIVPLLSAGNVVGVLEFAQLAQGPEFSAAEIDFAARLMPMITVALDNARLYEREHHIASILQQAVIADPKEIPGIETCCLYHPASTSTDVGGDFYDVFELPERRVAVVIGDVAGKGLAAAQLTSLVRDGVRAYALERPEPAWVLGQVNQLIARSVEAGMFATVCLAILDPVHDRLRYSLGGHPAAAICGAKGARLLDDVHSPIVGGFPRAEYLEAEAEFCPGDGLLLYTDGITEARRDGELFGTQRLLEAVASLHDRSIADTPRALLEIVLEFADGELTDDTAIVCVRRTG